MEFLNKERKYLQHATAGEINRVIAKIVGINVRNESIIGAGSKLKLI